MGPSFTFKFTNPVALGKTGFMKKTDTFMYTNWVNPANLPYIVYQGRVYGLKDIPSEYLSKPTRIGGQRRRRKTRSHVYM